MKRPFAFTFLVPHISDCLYSVCFQKSETLFTEIKPVYNFAALLYIKDKLAFINYVVFIFRETYICVSFYPFQDLEKIEKLKRECSFQIARMCFEFESNEPSQSRSNCKDSNIEY